MFVSKHLTGCVHTVRDTDLSNKRTSQHPINSINVPTKASCTLTLHFLTVNLSPWVDTV